jgi:hypothetical protein
LAVIDFSRPLFNELDFMKEKRNEI